ncbi:hypothetical protein NX722_20410 [Endozoicomonas gorgoniicola]|uniref:Uncharacterized protein n=1 Tax=Endozoicomonas gorgoniicola TaxID=1234144 RepID=A0ABT3N177_9GAMM|nr:hypothetical protein [Endozoicomonas gorgoniicola]MCW7554939.1 hypothetical protein [Endozoicomonas gorgoniicola]
MSLSSAQELLELSRSFYKGSVKSSNKRYSYGYGATPFNRKFQRNFNSKKASSALATIKAPGDIYRTLEACEPQNRFGNCSQYSLIAARYGLMKKIPNIWIAVHEDGVHTFLVLARESFNFESLTFADFSEVGDRAFFVCDPWFNVACEVGLYKIMILMKSSQWADQGKEILSIFSPDPEKATEWVKRLFIGRILFYQLTDNNGNPTRFYAEDFLGSNFS